MADFRSVARWTVEHWKAWSIPAVIGTIVSVIGWSRARRKEWKESKQARTESEVDSQVLGALGNPNLWPMPRPITGAGVPVVRASEVAEHLSLDTDTVYE